MFVSVYKYFKKNKILFLILLLVIFILSIFSILRLKKEENIFAFLPRNKNIENIKNIYENTSISDKLIVQISNKKEDDYAILIDYADNLVGRLQSKLGENVKELQYKIDEETFFDVYNSFYNNLPYFIDNQKYNELKNLDKNKLDTILSNNYNVLISPSSLVLKKFLLKDPIGILSPSLAKLKNFDISGDFELLDGYIFSKDHKKLFIFITPSFSSNETDKCEKFINILDNEIRQQNKNYEQNIEVFYYGGMAVALSNAQRTQADLIITLAIALFLQIVFILLVFPRKNTIFIAFLPTIFGILLGLASIYIIKGSISVITIGIALPVLIGITTNYSLYIISSFYQTNNIQQVIKEFLPAIFLCAFTTIVGFFALFFTHSDLLSELALLSILSIIFSAIFSLIILPQFLYKSDKQIRIKLNIIDKIAKFSFHKSKILLILLLTSIIFAFIFTPDTKFDGDLNNLNYLDKNLKKSEVEINKISSNAMKNIFIVSTGKTLDKAIENSNKLIIHLDKLQKNKIINRYISINSIIPIKREQRERLRNWENLWTERNKKEFTNNLINIGGKYHFKSDAFASFIDLINKKPHQFNLDNFVKENKAIFSNYINYKHHKYSITTIVKVSDNNRKLANDKLNKMVNSKDTIIFDKYYFTSQFIDFLKSNMEMLATIASLLVFLILLIYYGRIELALITIAPVILSWLLLLAAMNLLGIEFNIANIIISSLIFGLAGDYAILITQAILLEANKNEKALARYKTAIIFSAILLLFGIGTLIFAMHPAIKSIAMVSILGILISLLVCFALQPIALRWLFYNKYNLKRALIINFVDIVNSTISLSFFVFGSVFISILLPILLIIPFVNRKSKQNIIHFFVRYFCIIQVYVAIFVKKRYFNEYKERFKKPAIVISNHSSNVDILYLLGLKRKMIILTTKKERSNFLYGAFIRFLGFYDVSDRYEKLLPLLKSKIENGYSIGIFPEGTRSNDNEVNRFHKGAFYLAQELKIDIVPLVLFGIGDVMKKGEIMVRRGEANIKILKRVEYKEFENIHYSLLAKQFRELIKNEHSNFGKQINITKHFGHQLIRRFIYRSPVIEWYLRVKLIAENNYKLINDIVPLNCKIYDIGCGMGFVSIMLKLISAQREIIAIDYDQNKIDIAQNSILENEKINFICANIKNYEFEKADIFIISDVLHYLNKENQTKLIEKCVKSLNEGGKIIIKEADASNTEKHKRTIFTEYLSTKLIKFNKTENELEFLTIDEFQKICKNLGKNLKVVENKKHTSNNLLVISSV